MGVARILGLVVAATAFGTTSCGEGSCDPCDCGNACALRVCFKTAEGHSPFNALQDSFFLHGTITAREFGFGTSSYPDGWATPKNGELAYFNGPPSDDGCIESWVCGKKNKDTFAAAFWAKVGGYKPAVTYPVYCDDEVVQVLEPAPPEMEAGEICPTRPAGSPCTASGVVTMSDGSNGTDTRVWSAADFTPATTQEPSAYAYGPTGTQATFQVTAATAVFYKEGYLPRAVCLACGDQTVELEMAPLEFVPPAQGCRVGGSTSGGLIALLAAMFVGAGGVARRRR